MKITKRILSTILLVALLVGIVPTNANAVESSSTVQSSQTTVVGNNSFGALLSDDIQEQETEDSEEHSGGYNVTGLTVENSVATVEYDTLEKAVLVVSLYSEDGLQLLVSANTVVQPENNIATVTLNGSIPEYFMASAYLLDTYDYSPLCAAYDTPMYTKEMQDLLASTTDDYDQDKVLNLDSSKDTNFAVYADTTKVLEYKVGVNNVISADDETATYIIGNADNNVTGLKAGDILAYSYGENQVLIVKVAMLSVDGTTVTITGADLEMEEVFSHVKVESNGNTEDITVDEATGDDDVTYVGMISDDASVMATRNAYAVNPTGDYTGKLSLGFELEKESGSIKYSGSLTLNLKVDFSYYVSTSRQFVELEIDTQTKLAFKISGEAELTKKLPNLNFSPIPAVSVGFKPELVLKFTAEVELSLSVGSKTGFSYENGKGVQDLSTSPKVQMDLDVEGKVFFGLDLGPAVWVLDGHIAEIKFSALAGIELKGEMGGTNFDDFQLVGGKEVKDSIHTCESCLEISLSAKIEFSLKLKFLNLSFLKFDFKLTDKVFDIGEAYYSFDHKEFGWGSCPNKSYHVTVYVQNAQGQDAFGVDVVAGWAEKLTEIPLGKTNSNGVVEYYLQAGTYTFMTTVDGDNLGKAVTVEEACKVTLDKDSIGGIPTFISGIIDPDSVTDNGIVASGACGEDGDNVKWILYGSGLLSIEGSGNMDDYTSAKKVPWYSYSDYIKSVHIKEGVTSIGEYCFADCATLENLQLPETVETIGYRAFNGCEGLTFFEIPGGVKKIESYAFGGCVNIHNVYVSEMTQWYNISLGNAYSNPMYFGADLYANNQLVTEITIPIVLTNVSDYRFYGCTSLVGLTIPESITSIGKSSFFGCTSLKEISISYGLDTISSSAFQNCSALKEVSLPNSVLSLGESAFEGCSSLQSAALPKGVTTLPKSLFKDCVSLLTVELPSELITLDDAVFRGCSSMEQISLPESTCVLEDRVFYDCQNLKEVLLGENVQSIGSHCFSGCETLSAIYIPKTISFIGFYSFFNCESLKTVYTPELYSWCQIEFDGEYSNPLSNGAALYIDNDLVVNLTIPQSFGLVKAYSFNGCSSLNHVTIEEGITSIEGKAFYGCSNLNSIDIPTSVSKLGSYTFAASGLLQLEIPDAVTDLPTGLCQWCDNLEQVVIGTGATTIGMYAFGICSSMNEIYFTGDAPTKIEMFAFSLNSAIRYYPAGNSTWAAFLEGETGSKWQPYTTINVLSIEANTTASDSVTSNAYSTLLNESVGSEASANLPMLTSIYDGEYGTEITEQYTLKTASFTGLVPGEQYLLLALVSIETDSILAPENLLYIDQGVAAEDGTLTFTYAQREVSDTSYVMACGASHNDLNDAVITFPSMLASDQVQVVHPKVEYNGETLVEGVDYVVVGTVAYTSAGQYTCYVRGIYNYSGLVQCQYTVADKKPGDVNGDGAVDTLDRMVLSRYLANWDEYDEASINITAADVNGDGVVDTLDRMVLNRYLANWEGYEDIEALNSN